MAKENKALATLHGYDVTCELIEVINDTAKIRMDGREYMTGKWNVEAKNKKAEVLLGIKEDG